MRPHFVSSVGVVNRRFTPRTRMETVLHIFNAHERLPGAAASLRGDQKEKDNGMGYSVVVVATVHDEYSTYIYSTPGTS